MGEARNRNETKTRQHRRMDKQGATMDVQRDESFAADITIDYGQLAMTGRFSSDQCNGTRLDYLELKHPDTMPSGEQIATIRLSIGRTNELFDGLCILRHALMELNGTWSAERCKEKLPF